jgi:uncharacterized protein YdhG (YjbR/CyaY superfamily)
MARTNIASVDDYIAAQPLAARPVLERVRAILRKALPRATERISYRIPTYELDGVMVLYFAGFQQHYGIYPTTPGLMHTLGNELADYRHGKGTLRFPMFAKIPTALITRIAKHRAAEAVELKLARAAKKSKKKAAKKTTAKKTTSAKKKRVKSRE